MWQRSEIPRSDRGTHWADPSVVFEHRIYSQSLQHLSCALEEPLLCSICGRGSLALGRAGLMLNCLGTSQNWSN